MKNVSVLAGVVVAAIASMGGCPGTCKCSITTSQLPAAVVGQSYSARLEAGLTCTYDLSKPTHFPSTKPNWSVSTGALPLGLSLSEDGMLSGVPATPGSFPFSVGADCYSGSVKERLSKQFEIVVSAR